MKFSRIIAVLIAVCALLWIGSGLLLHDAQDPQNTEQEQAVSVEDKKLTSVRVKQSTAESFADAIIITGRTQASRSVELKAETAGQIIALKKEEGQRVKKGEAIAAIEPRDRDARVREARERVSQRRIEYNAAKKLAERGFNSKVRLSQALADLEAAKAALKDAEVDRGKTTIRAPFDGTISDQLIEFGDYVRVGDAMFTIVDLNPLEITGFVSERRVHEVETGAKGSAELLNGNTVNGQVSYIAPAADPRTRTFQVTISIANDDLQIGDGLTTKLFIPVAPKKAHKISPSILSLDDAGKIGIKIVDQNDTVSFIPIKILADKTDAMWVSGLPDQVRIITVGQDFVMNGQMVDPVQEGILDTTPPAVEEPEMLGAAQQEERP